MDLKSLVRDPDPELIRKTDYLDRPGYYLNQYVHILRHESPSKHDRALLLKDIDRLSRPRMRRKPPKESV